jgi:PHD/YefM family antitoxin component YafN of YafNO toxin-antitoxin module
MITYGSNELISSTDLAKHFGTYLTQVSQHTVDKIAILKNNKIEAVIVARAEYEALREAQIELELLKQVTSIKQGLDDVKYVRTRPIEEFLNELKNSDK